MKTLLVYGAIATALFAAAIQAQELSLSADSAVLNGPFKLTNGYLSQPVNTSLTNGGRALFAFSITNTGSYVLQVTVNAQTTQPHAFAVNIDAEPKAPEMICDTSVTAGFEPHIVSWRGNGTAASPQFSPKAFTLSAGAHQLIVRGMDSNTQLQRLSLLRLPAPPTGLHVVTGP